MNRKDFFRTATAISTATFISPSSVIGQRPADLVLRGAHVFDGTGRKSREVDVAITGDRITAIGSTLPPGSSEINLQGLALAPGFIDIHSHADLSLLINNKAESRIRQGVTLEIVGQDGNSVGPWSDAGLEDTRDSYLNNYGIEIDFRDPLGFLDRIDLERPAVNVGTMVGNGTLRGLVVGFSDRTATEAEMSTMKSLLSKQIAGGCVGLSSGLEYTPSGLADPGELVELASTLKGTGCPYASHMRNEDDRLLAAIEEALHVGRLANVPVQISHLKAQGKRNYWKADAALKLIEQARADGVDVHFDRYPYTAYATGLSNLFPSEYRTGGNQAFLRRLRDPEYANLLENACREKVALLGDWNSIQISSTGASSAWARGGLVGDLARARGIEAYALTIELLEANAGSVGMIGHGMSEENTAKILAHPLGMLCSDGGSYAPYGSLSSSSPHPRGYGSFPRFLGHYVRDSQALTLESAIHKVTLMPAQKLQLQDRGMIAPGAFADLVAFDPTTIADQATFDNPHQYPTGIPLVIVNGVVTLQDGEHTGALGGRSVRRTSL